MAEMTPAQLERIKQQRAQRYKEIGLPSTAGQIMDIPVENMPEQRIYQAPAPVIQEAVQPQYEALQYEAPSNRETMDDSNQGDISNKILIQLAEERAQRQSVMYNAPRDKFNALEQIRKGAKKQEFNTFMKVESRGVNGNQLPEPKVGRKQTRPGQPQERTKNPIAPQTFTPRGSSEADTLESLFTDKSPGISMRSTNGAAPQGTLINVNEDYSNIGPSFDPVAHLRNKASQKGIDLTFPNKKVLNENQVFKTEGNGQMEQMMLMMETFMKGQQKSNSNYDLESLKEMMITIAQKVALQTMKKVISEYVDTQKKKNVFEVVSSKQNIIKIEGKNYQLKPVILKS